VEKKIMYTTSYDDIIESISDICNCSIDSINGYLEHSQPFCNTFVGDIELNPFFKKIGVHFTGNNELYEIIQFHSCVISHLTTRINQPDKSDIYYLVKAFSEPTDISNFLANKGLTFEKTAQGLITYHNDKIVEWNSYDNTAIYRIIKRLRIKGKYIDNCINGFLFNDKIWEDSNVEHIKDCPEIISDICNVLHRQDIINEWENISKTYAIGFFVDVKDIIFDEHTRFNTKKSKMYLIYKYVIYYLVQNYHGLWRPRFDNPIIRLQDNQIVDKNDIFGFYEIEE
jgi:hypothetical protein